jgi:hypothetical protein
MQAEKDTKEPEVDFTQLARGGKAPVKGQTNSARITHILLQSGTLVEIIPGSFALFKNTDGVPFVEYKAYIEFNTSGEPLAHKTFQLFPATVAGWAFDE